MRGRNNRVSELKYPYSACDNSACMDHLAVRSRRPHARPRSPEPVRVLILRHRLPLCRAAADGRPPGRVSLLLAGLRVGGEEVAEPLQCGLWEARQLTVTTGAFGNHPQSTWAIHCNKLVTPHMNFTRIHRYLCVWHAVQGVVERAASPPEMRSPVLYCSQCVWHAVAHRRGRAQLLEEGRGVDRQLEYLAAGPLQWHTHAPPCEIRHTHRVCIFDREGCLC